MDCKEPISGIYKMCQPEPTPKTANEPTPDDIVDKINATIAHLSADVQGYIIREVTTYAKTRFSAQIALAHSELQNAEKAENLFEAELNAVYVTSK
jgi:hypothetical protein